MSDSGPDRGPETLGFERKAIERARRLWRRYGEVLKGWLIFVAVIGVGAALDEKANHLVNTRFSEITAQVSAWLLGVLGAGGRAEGTMLISSYCVFEIIGECTGYYPCVIYTAAVLAYPCRFSRRLLGIALGLPALLLINQSRLISLCYVYRLSHENFEVIHVLVWQSLIIFFTVMLWILWVSTLARGHELHSA